MNGRVGTHVYGIAAAIFGAATLLWRDPAMWPQLRTLSTPAIVVPVMGVAAAIAVAAGLALQWRPAMRFGATALGALYLCSALLYVPRIVQAPAIYDRWGNFFEQFSMFCGAVIVYAGTSSLRSSWRLRLGRAGVICFGLCVVSFALEQAFYLNATAALVPPWMPLGQMFWALATTGAFALAAVAILSGRQRVLASRLLTVMLLLFGILIWIPALAANPHSRFDWSETVETFAIAGVAWILADHLRRDATRNTQTTFRQ